MKKVLFPIIIVLVTVCLFACAYVAPTNNKNENSVVSTSFTASNPAVNTTNVTAEQTDEDIFEVPTQEISVDVENPIVEEQKPTTNEDEPTIEEEDEIEHPTINVEEIAKEEIKEEKKDTTTTTSTPIKQNIKSEESTTSSNTAVVPTQPKTEQPTEIIAEELGVDPTPSKYFYDASVVDYNAPSNDAPNMYNDFGKSDCSRDFYTGECVYAGYYDNKD